jgi:hypothetical protein
MTKDASDRAPRPQAQASQQPIDEQRDLAAPVRPPEGLEKVFTVDEIALTGIAKRTKLYADIKSGLLPTIKNGRLRRVTASGFRQYLAAIAAQSAAPTR